MKNSTPGHPAALALAEREKRVLVTLIDGRLALVIPHSVMSVQGRSDKEVADLIARIANAVNIALSE